MVAQRPRLRLLHTSDVHLGAYDSGSAESREKLHDTFRSVVDVGRTQRVDFMLIAGDFFDNARVKEETLRFAVDQLNRLERPIVIGPGNHDNIGPGSVYDRLDFPAHVPGLSLLREPDGELVTVDGLPVEVWGKSHTELDPAFQPFRDPPPRGDAAWQVGVGHGHYLHPEALRHHSYHIRKEHLAQFQRDYVALGHWEQLTRVEAGEGMVAAYSGAPEALGFTRAIGGRVLIVDLFEDGSVRLTAHSLEEAPPIPHDDLPFLFGIPPDPE